MYAHTCMYMCVHMLDSCMYVCTGMYVCVYRDVWMCVQGCMDVCTGMYGCVYRLQGCMDVGGCLTILATLYVVITPVLK